MKLLISILSTLLVGYVSGMLTRSEIGTWYATLTKPSFNPPNYIFGPVWTLLYLMMGIAFYLIWRSTAQPGRRNAILLFLVQLAFNFCWSLIFFNLHRLDLSLIWIIILLLLIAATIWQFSRISRVAAALLVPYLLWVSFATVLNFSLWQLN
jgi:tryptophan-rich sensory protein